MNYILRDLASTEKFKKYINTKTYPINISGIVSVAKSELIAATYEEKRKPICVITYNEIQAKEILKNLSFFLEDIYYFPKKEISAYDYLVESREISYERIDILNKIYENKANVIVTTIEAIMQNMIAKDALYKNILNLKVGDNITHEDIKEKLAHMGYERKDLIENRGEFSIRGDIVDIGIKENEGIRIEFWGDDIDSIRKFKILSQRSTEMLKSVEIYPAIENILEDSKEDVLRRIENSKQNFLSADLEIILEGNYESKIDKYFNEFYTNQNNLLDYVKNYEIFIDEPEKIKQRIDAIKKESKNLIKSLIEKEKFVPELLGNINNFTLNIKNVVNLRQEDTLKNDFNTKEANLFKGDIKSLELGIKNAVKDKKRVVILAGDKENADKIKKAIDKNLLLVDTLDNVILKPGEVIISTGALSGGFEDLDTKLVVLSSDEFFVRQKRPKKLSNTFKTGEKIVFADLKIGDYIVHRNHGIGIYAGVNTIKLDGITKDYIQLKYKGGDVLYIPTEDLDNVRKYIGGEGNLNLNKLGTKEWEKTKAKVKGNLREVAKELIALYAKRENSKGYAFSKDNVFEREFADSFPYKETEDQLRCIEEVKKDMEAQKPMDRLLCRRCWIW